MSSLNSDYFGNIIKLRSLIDCCDDTALSNVITLDFLYKIFNLDIKNLLKLLLNNILTNDVLLNRFYHEILHLSNMNNNSNNNDKLSLLDMDTNILYKSLQYLKKKSIISFEKVNRECCYLARSPIVFGHIPVKLGKVLNKQVSSFVPNIINNDPKQLCKRFSKVNTIHTTPKEMDKYNFKKLFPDVVDLKVMEKNENSVDIISPISDLHKLKALHTRIISISTKNLNNFVSLMNKLHVLYAGFKMDDDLKKNNDIIMNSFKNLSKRSNLKSYTCRPTNIKANLSISRNIITYYGDSLLHLSLPNSIFTHLSNITNMDNIVLKNLEELHILDIQYKFINKYIKFPNIKRCDLNFHRSFAVSTAINHIFSESNVQQIFMYFALLPTNDLLTQFKQIQFPKKKNKQLLFEFPYEIIWDDFIMFKDIMLDIQLHHIIEVCINMENKNNINMYKRNYKTIFEWMSITDMETVYLSNTKKMPNIDWYGSAETQVSIYENTKLYVTHLDEWIEII